MPNYGMLSNIANGIREGLMAYQTQKQINRQEEMQNLMAGVQRNPETGELEYTPQKMQQMEQQRQMQELQRQKLEGETGLLKAKAEYYGAKGEGTDEDLDRQLKQAKIEALKRGPQGYGAPANLQIRGEKGAYGMHEGAVKAVTQDPYTKQLLTSYQNLNNALSNFEQGGKNPQEFHELQQAVRANLGIKGASIGSERARTVMESFNMKIGDLQQFLSGNPQSVEEMSPKMVEVIRSIVHNEMKNKKTQAMDQIAKNRKAQEAVYQSGLMQSYGKQYQPAFEQSVEGLQQQFGNEGAPTAGVQNQGLINLTGGTERQGGPITPQDQEALEWVHKNPNHPKAAEIRKTLGAKYGSGI